MFSKLPPFSKSKQQQLQTTPSLCRPLSPLDIPELLQHIFSFLNQRSLRIAILVCRQWLYLNQHRLHREVIWDFSWGLSTLTQTMKRLPGADRLVLRKYQSTIQENNPDLQKILQSIQVTPGIGLVASCLWFAIDVLFRSIPMPPPIEGFSRPIRELVFHSNEFSEEWINQLPLPPTLTSLKIDRRWEFKIDVARIIVVCPLLESLDLSASGSLIFQGPCTERGKDALPSRLPLRSLVLRNLCAPQSWLEDLLSVTPDLETLKLIELNKYYDERAMEHWDWDRFRAHLQALSLPRKQLFYAERWKPQDICPPDGWRMSEELPYTSRPLHQLLCESSNLRHLKTLKMPYMTAFMDVHRRIPMYPEPATLYMHLAEHQQEQRQEQEHEQGTPDSNNVPGIWICRGLESLELNLHFHDQAIENGTHHARIVYGYIATVCPHLIDLRLRFEDECSIENYYWQSRDRPLILESGLCLLSRLRRLERLWIDHGLLDYNNPSELNWLAQSGRTKEHRAARREIVVGWAERLQEEAAMEAGRLENSSASVADEILGPRADDEDVVRGLRNLGLLQDVANTVGEMDTDGYEILPELFKIALYHHELEQNPEKEMKSLFGPQDGLGLKTKVMSWISP
ncbi:hypothetical protein K457DRAFT_150945 [Linnemannia elongata AG-77]|uniref:F-box domain-containing protein n=1 Tax=Linnemannia elongata AG-77 TaxID=1314771 RepID=A0A197KKT9_9FUNG|nr:hypothetical protein K457DRAFT_150945 [Linnemannia elongata AG-77]